MIARPQELFVEYLAAFLEGAMRFKDEDIRPNVLVNMDVTKARFAVLNTPSDARWRLLRFRPNTHLVVDSALVHRAYLATRVEYPANRHLAPLD